MFWLRILLLLLLCGSLVIVLLLAPSTPILWILTGIIAVVGISLTLWKNITVPVSNQASAGVSPDETSSTSPANGNATPTSTSPANGNATPSDKQLPDIPLVILAILTLVISTIAVAFISFSVIAVRIAILLPFIWIVLFYFAWRMMWQTVIIVPGNTTLIIRSFFNNKLYSYPGSQELSPSLRFLAKEYARIPTHDLVHRFQVETINTKLLQDIKSITLEICYNVTDPEQLLRSPLNRDNVLEKVASAFNLTVRQGMLRTDFWQHLLNQQFQDVSDSLLRISVYKLIERAVDASAERQHLADNLRESLKQHSKLWGVEIVSLTIPSVDLDPEQIKRKFQDKMKENRDAAEMEATRIELIGIAQARIEAQAIKEWILAIQQAGKPLPPDVIEKIIFNALEKMHEKQRLELIQKNLVPNNAHQQSPPTS